LAVRLLASTSFLFCLSAAGSSYVGVGAEERGDRALVDRDCAAVPQRALQVEAVLVLKVLKVVTFGVLRWSIDRLLLGNRIVTPKFSSRN
jgi:hypothetical protein